MPRLSLDRPFTYVLPEGTGAGTGSLVSVPFHGRTLRGWVLGPAGEVPPGRLLPVRRVRSGVRFFDRPMLSLLRWVGERYLAPLATAIERSHPPRVAGEETKTGRAAPDAGVSADLSAGPMFEPGTTTWHRPLPGQEAADCAGAVGAVLAAGRRAVVLVPEAEPLPRTAGALVEAFGPRAALFLGGDARERYRMWLDIRAGRFDVVVATRPGVFSPLPDLGLIWVAREAHPGHREDRSPYYHVRDVAMARARLHGAACVVAAYSPSVEAGSLAATGMVGVSRAPRPAERAAAPLVETTPPEHEDRSPRLGTLLKRVRSAALILSRRGYGIARVCRSCGEPAACARCRGPIEVAGGRNRCRVCGAVGACANCGGLSFGVDRGGTERVAEWAAAIAPVPVNLEREGEPPPPPGLDRILVGTAAAAKDVGPVGLDLVAILDPDRALARAGTHAAEQAVATWMEAAAWAAPRGAGGRVLMQTRHPGHPAIQALIRWEPEVFLRAEAARRAEAGFAPNHPSFRIEGTGAAAALEAALAAAGAETTLATSLEDRTVCLVAVRPERMDAFRQAVLGLVQDGTVTRVEAEPQL